jgi:ferredoxin
MEVKITEECIACERCVEICPNVFQMGDDYAEVSVSSIPGEQEEKVQEAADECPVEAIIIE